LVRAGRGRRWVLAVLSAAVATIAAGAAAPNVGAGSESAIIFSVNETGVTGFSFGGSSSGQSIRLDFGADKPPLPKKFVIEIPSGYTLDLTAKPGTNIGDVAISIVGVNTPSFATGLGSLDAKDPKDFLSDPVAQACAPGVHAAVWAVSTSIAGQQVSMTVFADPAQAGGGYVLQACPAGLAIADAVSSASISLSGINLVSPTSPGDYRWRTIVTPQTRSAYELQAVVPLPESVTLKARYDRKRKTATVSGTVVEGGRPVPRAPVVIYGSSGTNGNDDDSDLDLFEALTNAQGHFTIKARIARTTDFTVSVSPSVGSCARESTASAGCLGARIIPPDDGFTTVWVSVPGGAVRTIRDVDQRRADQAGLAATDLPAGFETTPGGGDACLNFKQESKLTITGESTSPSFYQLDQGDSLSLIQTRGLTRIYASAKQARQALEHQARASTLRCELKGLDTNVPPIKALRVPGVSARLRAFRASLSLEGGIAANYDIVFLQRGRSVTLIAFLFLNAPDDLEGRVAAALALRMR
jgi:hypothetical protein